MRTDSEKKNCEQIEGVELKVAALETTKKSGIVKKNTLNQHNPQQTTSQTPDQKSHDVSTVIDSKHFQADIQNFSVENIKSIIDQINDETDVQKKNGLMLKYNRNNCIQVHTT